MEAQERQRVQKLEQARNEGARRARILAMRAAGPKGVKEKTWAHVADGFFRRLEADEKQHKAKVEEERKARLEELRAEKRMVWNPAARRLEPTVYRPPKVEWSEVAGDFFDRNSAFLESREATIERLRKAEDERLHAELTKTFKLSLTPESSARIEAERGSFMERTEADLAERKRRQQVYERTVAKMQGAHERAVRRAARAARRNEQGRLVLPYRDPHDADATFASGAGDTESPLRPSSASPGVRASRASSASWVRSHDRPRSASATLREPSEPSGVPPPPKEIGGGGVAVGGGGGGGGATASASSSSGASAGSLGAGTAKPTVEVR